MKFNIEAGLVFAIRLLNGGFGFGQLPNPAISLSESIEQMMGVPMFCESGLRVPELPIANEWLTLCAWKEVEIADTTT